MEVFTIFLFVCNFGFIRASAHRRLCGNDKVVESIKKTSENKDKKKRVRDKGMILFCIYIKGASARRAGVMRWNRVDVLGLK